MRLLFITQKIDQNDDDLAFTILWIKEFIKQGFHVSVICLQKGEFDDSFPVYSLGKEEGRGKVARLWLLFSLIMTLRYDRVFVHMNPEYFTVGGWWWFIKGIPTYLWYTHYTMTVHLFIAGLFAKRLFAATAQSLPQYENSKKKVVLGHGIDTKFWGSLPDNDRDPYALLAVHRLSRSKCIKLAIETLALLSERYTLTVYGRAIDQNYFKELQTLINKKHLSNRVHFMGSVPMHELRTVYPRHRLMINMASETIDKTMLEAMFLGVYPVTTPNNAKAIGLFVYPKDKSPDALAEFIESKKWNKISRECLRDIVTKRHRLPTLISYISKYISSGT